MAHAIYDKTDKGREEIATRKYGLATRLRAMLVMVDGRQDSAALLGKLAGLGLTGDSVRALVEDGYIALADGAGLPAAASAAAAASAPAAPETSAAALPATVAAAPQLAAIAPSPSRSAQQYQALHDFYNQTIKSTLGLRGYRLQLKVEKAASVDDFRALRQAFLDAVRKSKGEDMARSLGARLGQLLDENLQDDGTGQ